MAPLCPASGHCGITARDANAHLICVEQDAAVAAALETTRVLSGVAGGVALLKKISAFVARHAVKGSGATPRESIAIGGVSLAQLTRGATVAQARGLTGGSKHHEGG